MSGPHGVANQYGTRQVRLSGNGANAYLESASRGFKFVATNLTCSLFFAVPTRSKGMYQSQLRNIANIANIANIIVVNKTADHKIQDKVAANSATETLRPARQAR